MSDLLGAGVLAETGPSDLWDLLQGGVGMQKVSLEAWVVGAVCVMGFAAAVALIVRMAG